MKSVLEMLSAIMISISKGGKESMRNTLGSCRMGTWNAQCHVTLQFHHLLCSWWNEKYPFVFIVWCPKFCSFLLHCPMLSLFKEVKCQSVLGYTPPQVCTLENTLTYKHLHTHSSAFRVRPKFQCEVKVHTQVYFWTLRGSKGSNASYFL